MKTIFAIAFMIILAIPGFSQETFVEPPSREITKIPFTQFTGGVIVFKALLENFPDSLSFILDSGSGGISLDSTTVASLGLSPSEPERLIRGIGGIRKVGFVKNKTITLNQLKVDSLNFHVIDYEILSALYGEKIDGIAGYSLLSRYIVKIDYEEKNLSFWSNGTLKYPRGGYMIRPRINSIPFSMASVRDARRADFRYLLDIGAGLAALYSQDYIEDSAFLKTKRKKYLKQGEGLGGKVDMYITILKELKLGPYKFRNVPINIFDDTYNITSYPTLGGLIGNEIFRRFNCIINYRNREIFIKPNKFFSDPFDYAYSGIELYLIDGKVLVGDIPKGSPADNAGLVAGDEVIAVNKKFGMRLDELKQALQGTYGPVKIIINRNGELQNKTIKIINIINGKAISNQTMTNTFREGIQIRTQYNNESFGIPRTQ
ncbi:MAG TPA: aspartyl protease family protein [Niabella sp.]|nr:aspartyl protease family protein [Niabella sp.]HQW14391.1 aspartyl protease family protein [Niabella sp.]HQX18330.1 aspartyl protease family protein [Niabella sp.]HQX42488.1 aspartyl protease family protein [Niabella sp.]HRB05855.1 aspartyl protease family protein [Niabella sp.]